MKFKLPYIGEEMTKKKAKRIEELRCGPICHSWRRISEIICEEFDDENKKLAGNQIHGKDLCTEAIKTIHGKNNIKNIPKKIRDKWN